MKSTQGPRLREEPVHHVNTRALLTAVGAASETPSTLQTPGPAAPRGCELHGHGQRRTFLEQRKAGEKPGHWRWTESHASHPACSPFTGALRVPGLEVTPDNQREIL